MGKTFRRDQSYRPKKGGKVFDKDQLSKKRRRPVDRVQPTEYPPEYRRDYT